MARISIKTTSLCQGLCNDCSVRGWMNYYHNWHAPLEDIEKFIYYSKKSNYFFDVICLAGGEPLLWKNLLPGLKMLKEAKITAQLEIYTNALALNDSTKNEIGEALNYLDFIRVSKYVGNEDACEKFKATFPDRPIQIYGHRSRHISPVEPQEDAIPADCKCPSLTLDHGVIDICTSARTIILRMGWKFEDFPRLSTELKENYLSFWHPGERESQELCKYCIANAKIHDKLEMVECEIGSYRGNNG